MFPEQRQYAFPLVHHLGWGWGWRLACFLGSDVIGRGGLGENFKAEQLGQGIVQLAAEFRD